MSIRSVTRIPVQNPEQRTESIKLLCEIINSPSFPFAPEARCPHICPLLVVCNPLGRTPLEMGVFGGGKIIPQNNHPLPTISGREAGISNGSPPPEMCLCVYLDRKYGRRHRNDSHNAFYEFRTLTTDYLWRNPCLMGARAGFGRESTQPAGNGSITNPNPRQQSQKK